MQSLIWIAVFVLVWCVVEGSRLRYVCVRVSIFQLIAIFRRNENFCCLVCHWMETTGARNLSTGHTRITNTSKQFKQNFPDIGQDQTTSYEEKRGDGRAFRLNWIKNQQTLLSTECVRVRFCVSVEYENMISRCRCLVTLPIHHHQFSFGSMTIVSISSCFWPKTQFRQTFDVRAYFEKSC